MKYPLVSVVMPTLNSARFIRESIHSLIDQVYSPFELIVVDGGSTDDTIKIVESYMGDDDLKLIRLSGEAGSIPRSLNAGLAAARGEFIARMDGDDLAYKWRLNDQVFHLITDPTCQVVGTGVDLFWTREGSHRSPLTHEDIENMFLINNPFFHPTMMFRRSLIDDGILYYSDDQVTDEDYELWGRIIPRVRCANLNQSSIRYRIHNENAQWDPRKHRSKQRALKGFCESYGIYDQVLIDHLVEVQCSAFFRHDSYRHLRDYAVRAQREGLPRLGWIHDAIIAENSYAEFLTWFRRAKGWPV